MKAAAARARSLGSFDQALNFAEQAISVTAEPSDKVELMLDAAEDARIAGRLDHAKKLLAEAHGSGARRREHEQALCVTTALAAILATSFQVDDAWTLVEPALEEFAGEDDGLLAELRLAKGRVQFLKNDFAGSITTLDGALPVAERRGLVRIVATALMAKANGMWSLGRRREAFGLAYAARDLAAEHGMTEIQLRVMGNLANALTEKDVQLSLAASREQIELARKAGRRGQLLNSVGNYGYTAFLAGEWDAGLAEMERYLAEDMSGRDRLIMTNNALIIRAGRGEKIDDGLAEMERLGADMSGRWLLFYADPVANYALARGDLEKARSTFVELAEDDPGVGFEYLYRAARPALWARDVAGAKELLARYSEVGDFGPVADARMATLKAGIAALDGRSTEAIALYKEGIRGWRAVHAVIDEALAGVDAAELLDHSDPQVAEIVASTRVILERLRATPYLERLDAAVARAGAPTPTTKRSRSTAPAAEAAVTD